MPFMKLNDKIVTLLNPCPEVSEAALGERAELLIVPPDTPAFSMALAWGAGGEAEEVTLQAGEMVNVPEPVARDLEKAFRHRGLVIVENHASEQAARRVGLTRAIEFFRSRGSESIVDIQSARGWHDDQVSKMRNAGLRAQFLNRAREEVLLEHLEGLGAEPQKKGGKKAA